MEPDFAQRKLVGEAVLGFLDQFEQSRGEGPASSVQTDTEPVEELLAPPTEDGVAGGVLFSGGSIANQPTEASF